MMKEADTLATDDPLYALMTAADDISDAVLRGLAREYPEASLQYAADRLDPETLAYVTTKAPRYALKHASHRLDDDQFNYCASTLPQVAERYAPSRYSEWEKTLPVGQPDSLPTGNTKYTMSQILAGPSRGLPALEGDGRTAKRVRQKLLDLFRDVYPGHVLVKELITRTDKSRHIRRVEESSYSWGGYFWFLPPGQSDPESTIIVSFGCFHTKTEVARAEHLRLYPERFRHNYTVEIGQRFNRRKP
ncbi:MAG: hypothetical protein LAT68_16060 [Cyclobacteriaceae bacterium]|nr:hypothetical protein [Cyclobacteriaceae bacterium]